MWWRHLRDGGMTRGSRGEEGTYRNKFPVPASRTLSEKEERKGNRETGKWRLGGQQKHWHHKGEVFLCVMGQNTSKARGWKRIIILSVSSPTGVGGCREVWLGRSQTIGFMGKGIWLLHEHEWGGFNELLSKYHNSNKHCAVRKQMFKI